MRSGYSVKDREGRTERAGQRGQDREGRSERAGQRQGRQDREGKTETWQAGQRAGRTESGQAGQSGQDRGRRAERAGQSGQERERAGRTERAGQREQDRGMHSNLPFSECTMTSKFTSSTRLPSVDNMAGSARHQLIAMVLNVSRVAAGHHRALT